MSRQSIAAAYSAGQCTFLYMLSRPQKLLLLLLLPLLLLLLPIQAVLLPRGIGRSGEALRTSIEFKNAVDASYFSHCTSGFVPPDAHVVLVEVNMQ